MKKPMPKRGRFTTQQGGSSSPISQTGPEKNTGGIDRSVPRRIKKVVLYGSLTGSILLVSGGVYIQHLIQKAKDTTPSGEELYQKLKDRAALSTRILDYSGQVLATVGGKNEDDISLEEMNPYLIAALIGVEDKRFRYHNGFDNQAILGMLRDNFRWKLGVKDEARGGSTIGSQLFKEGSNEPRWRQKIKERVQAGKLFEQGEEAKRFALQYYLNNTYFIGDKQGSAAAAKIIFQKDQKDLTADECALIVGLAQNPTLLNPFLRASNAEQRTDEVLKDLIKAYQEQAFPPLFTKKYPGFSVHGGEVQQMIAGRTVDKVVKKYTKLSTRENYIPHATPYYLRLAQAYVDSLLSGPEHANMINQLLPGSGYRGIVKKDLDGRVDTLCVATGGFEITTTLHKDIQTLLTTGLKNHLDSLDKLRPYPEYPLDGAVLLVDNQTGEVWGDVRGRNYQKNQYDFRFAHVEQGSVIKALILGVALELGIIHSLEETYVDSPITLTHADYPIIQETQPWTPKNFGSYSGDTLNLGIAGLVHSRNTAPTYIFKKAAELGRGEEFLRVLYERLDLFGPGSYSASTNLKQNPQTGLGLMGSDLDLIAALYMAIAQGGSVIDHFSDVQQVTGEGGALIYPLSDDTPASLITIFPDSVCQALQPYLLEKGRLVSGGKKNILAKSGTTGEGNKIRMVIVTPRFTLSMVVGPVAYATPEKKIIGRGNRDATSLLSPLIRSYLKDMEAAGYYSQEELFFFQNE